MRRFLVGIGRISPFRHDLPPSDAAGLLNGRNLCIATECGIAT
jgi:hypothetical protein